MSTKKCILHLSASHAVSKTHSPACVCVAVQGLKNFTSKEIETAKTIPGHHKNPKFQNSNFPKFQFSKKPKKTKKNNCARTLPHPLFPPWSVQNCFFGFFWFLCFFWKIGILENWNFGNCLWGRGGLRQNRILSVAQKSIETQYKYIETKYKQNETMQKRAAQSAPF